ncbi:MAG: MerR family transcriptional regulator [Bacteroidia bacterium]|nr:MerR family transcriptional regulator [Bacteroidia bacterium]
MSNNFVHSSNKTTPSVPYKEVNEDHLKVYYPIGEVAEMLGVNVSLIRYWENEFDALKPVRNKKGNRFFTRNDLEYLRRIHQLVKVQGYTLDGAKKFLEESEQEWKRKQQLVQRLENIRAELQNLKRSLQL